MSGRPRLIVTGFGPFPGAPVNPTQWLVGRLKANPPPGDVAFTTAVVDVEYATLPAQLESAVAGFDPDIAIHFGLARECAGFRLERVARNAVAADRPDNSGALPQSERVCAGPDRLASRLPLAEMAARLEAAGLPVEWSDDAGGYLCNATMMLSLAGTVAGLVPPMSGFVHVPPVEGPRPAISSAALEAGARIVIDACLDAWKHGRDG